MISHSLEHLPFSMAGTFLTIARQAGSHRLVYRTVSARARNDEANARPAADFFEIALLGESGEMEYTATAQPHRLDLMVEGGGQVTILFADPDTLYFDASGVRLQLVARKPFQAQFSPASGLLCLLDAAARGWHQLRAGPDQNWDASLQGDSLSVTFSGGGAIRFNRHESRWEKPFPKFEEVLANREKEYARWQKHLPAVPERYHEAAELAWLNLWLCQVPGQGALTRRAIYMSKSWMNAIWAWDNCFTALAVADADPELAFDQLLLFFDHQEPRGMIPDLVNDQEAIFGYTKPPIQGWTVVRLAEKLGAKKSEDLIEGLYKPLSGLTDWWYRQRDFDDDGLCQYHHGNDSGWDNATIFDAGMPLEGADLSAYLVLQNEALSFMAKEVGKKVASLRWSVRAEEQLKNLLKHGVLEHRFISTLDGQSEAVESQSLISCMPMMLGSRLPGKVRKAMVDDLSPGGPFLGEFGLASEALSSPKYQADGYWRGPVWAAPNYLIFDGLVDAGEKKLARTIAERFCELCLRSPGFWENYDALSGQGQRCPGYSWTAAIFLLFAGWLEKNQKSES